MPKIALILCALSFAALAHGAEPLVDNEHVTVWDTAAVLPPAQHDFVEVSLSQKGTASFPGCALKVVAGVGGQQAAE